MLLNLFLNSVPRASAQDYRLPDLVNYYSSIYGNFIVPDEEKSSSISDVTFQLNQLGSFAPIGIHKFDLQYTQGLFRFDVMRFKQFMNADDLLDAKVSFYSKLRFDEFHQRHEAPYRYLAGWMTLNHPPVKKAELNIGEYYRRFSPKLPRPSNSVFFDSDFQEKIDHDTSTELTFENHPKALFNGDSIKEKVRLVKAAKKFILAAVMAYSCDSSSEELTQALIDKAADGIPVTLMMERFYMGIPFARCTHRLRRAGIDVVLVSDKWKPRSFLSFFHDKFWVRDAEEVIVGGQNIIKYENDSTGWNGMNRDTDLLLSGPIATDFSIQYIDLWKDYRGRRNRILEPLRNDFEAMKTNQRALGIRGESAYHSRLNDSNQRMNGACRALVQRPGVTHSLIADTLQSHFEVATHSILLSSPELSFTRENRFFASIQKAVQKNNIKAELILNGVDGGNGEFTIAMREAMIRAYQYGKNLKFRLWKKIYGFEPRKTASKHRTNLLEVMRNTGMRAWTHFNYMHAKQAYIDRTVTAISSMNLDRASMERNHEAGAICMDEQLSVQIENQLALDLANSVPVTE